MASHDEDPRHRPSDRTPDAHTLALPPDEAIDIVIRNMTRVEAADAVVARAAARVAARIAGGAVDRERAVAGRWPMWAARPRAAAAILACTAAIAVAVAAGLWIVIGHRTQTPIADRGAQVERRRDTPETNEPRRSAASPRADSARLAERGRDQADRVEVPAARDRLANRVSTAAPRVRSTSVSDTGGAPVASTADPFRSDLSSSTSAIVITAIAPAPLAPPAELAIASLQTSPLIVDAIPISSITMPPLESRQ